MITQQQICNMSALNTLFSALRHLGEVPVEALDEDQKKRLGKIQVQIDQLFQELYSEKKEEVQNTAATVSLFRVPLSTPENRGELPPQPRPSV